MSQRPSAWVVPVDDRIKLISERLDHNTFAADVPGLKNLLDDYLDPKIPVEKVDFHRGLLKVFKQSQADNTYQDLLAQHTEEEQERLERFVEGESPQIVCDGFCPGPSLGFREEVQKLHSAELVKVSAAGPVHVDGLSGDELEEKDGLFHKLVHGLAELFHVHGEKDEVQVIARCFELPYAKGLKGLQRRHIPELGLEHHKRTSLYMRTNKQGGDTAHRSVRKAAPHERQVLRV